MNLLADKKIILASKSPRRSQLLEQMGFEFEIRTMDVDESFPERLESAKVAEYIAIKKAEAFTDQLEKSELLITADTVVVHLDKILGKPQNKQEAFDFIKSMSNTHHEVYTGVCIKSNQSIHSFTDLSQVFFSPLSDEEIEYYIEKFQPFDKAGAYGIQEWIGHNFISKIEGSYTNIMGLPTEKLYQALRKMSVS